MAVSTHFKELKRFKPDYAPANITLWESQRTGMRVVVVDQEGPKVKGYFALATEIHDDSGAPHTLEHLVFMGSKSYKYKGLLDKLATRAYSMTNAYTDTDRTVYELDTAGWEGFAQILPVYLEHVLLPTLTDAGCYTEVHHIDPSGADAGVVYSEMQGTQNTQTDLMDLRARRLVYPEKVGFRYETGGLMEKLRVLTADRIRQFHRAMYQPKNLCLVLLGKVDEPGLLKVLDDFEDSVLDSVPRLDEPFNRPWSEQGRAPGLERSTVDTVEFPEEDESMGEVLIDFLGPEYSDDVQQVALAVFLSYLSGSSASLLDNTLVEKEQLASAIYYHTEPRPDTLIRFYLGGVITGSLESVERRFHEVLADAASKPLEMEYLLNCLRRDKSMLKMLVENSADTFSNEIILDHLYGNRDGSTLANLSTLKEFDTLENWSESQWRDFFSKWFVHNNHISILGKPSKALSDKLEADEKARVEKQRLELGQDGLERLKKRLKQATDENERDIPHELLNKFKVPPTDSIHFISTTTARSGHARDMGKLDNKVQRIVDQDKTNLKTFIHFEHIPTNFVHVQLAICTHAIPTTLRPLLPIYIENFFNTTLSRQGERIEFEDVVMGLEKDTVGFEINNGAAVGNPELISIALQIEPEKYETAIRWISDLLYNSIFDPVRIQAALAKLLANIPEEKRSGATMADAVSDMTHFTHKSSVRASNTLVKAVCLRRTMLQLQSSPHEVVADLEKIRTILGDPANHRAVIVANLESASMKNPVSAWSNFVPKDFQGNQGSLNRLDSPKDGLSEDGITTGRLAYVVPMSTIDSSFAVLTARAIDSYDDPRLPALMLAVAYLEAVEGPLWNAVRGTGLAYGVSFVRDTSTGLIVFRIYRSPDAYKAFTASKKAVEDLATGKVEIDDLAWEGAVSSIVLNIVEGQPTMATAARTSFMNQVIRSIPKDWQAQLMKKVETVTASEMKQVLEELVLPLFQANKANLTVTCSTLMQDKMVHGFAEAGFKPEIQPLSYFHDDYGLGGKDLGDMDEEAEDEEDGEDDDDDDDNDDDDED